jgi:cbb3-type cytochrome oxidase maturation protein
MEVLLYLIPLALLIGVVWLVAFVWSIRSNQYDDLEGAARRILNDDDEPPRKNPPPREEGKSGLG